MSAHQVLYVNKCDIKSLHIINRPRSNCLWDALKSTNPTTDAVYAWFKTWERLWRAQRTTRSILRRCLPNKLNLATDKGDLFVVWETRWKDYEELSKLKSRPVTFLSGLSQPPPPSWGYGGGGWIPRLSTLWWRQRATVVLVMSYIFDTISSNFIQIEWIVQIK